MKYEIILEFIDALPLMNRPEVFGLHPNAEIGYYTQATKQIWSLLIELQPQTCELIFTLIIAIKCEVTADLHLYYLY